MKEKLAKLIDVKSIVTVGLTAIFCILALKEVITSTEFMTIFTLVISFYFNKQKETTPDTTKKEED
ncbi:MAG: hypothetical protein IJP13_01485 [Lachnospiraceae bacterium]|nr:hypothetical protein [Lachnospiraceae bacterium]